MTHPAGAVGQSWWFLVEVLRSSVVLSSRRTATKRYAGRTELSWVGLSLGKGAADLSAHTQERGAQGILGDQLPCKGQRMHPDNMQEWQSGGPMGECC